MLHPRCVHRVQSSKTGIHYRVLSPVSLFLVCNDVLFFSCIQLYIILLLLFSRSDHCRLWKGVMSELLEVTRQRHFVRDRANLKKTKRSSLRPSKLTEVVELMQNRALWPSVMRELTEKYELKKNRMRHLSVSRRRTLGG